MATFFCQNLEYPFVQMETLGHRISFGILLQVLDVLFLREVPKLVLSRLLALQWFKVRERGDIGTARQTTADPSADANTTTRQSVWRFPVSSLAIQALLASRFPQLLK